MFWPKNVGQEKVREIGFALLRAKIKTGERDSVIYLKNKSAIQCFKISHLDINYTEKVSSFVPFWRARFVLFEVQTVNLWKETYFEKISLLSFFTALHSI